MQAHILCLNCNAANPQGKVLCTTCGKPLLVTPPAPTRPLTQQQQPVPPPTIPFNIMSAAAYTHKPYVGPAQTHVQQGIGIQGVAVGRSGSVLISATFAERIAIGVLRFFGWFWLLISIILSIGVFLLGTLDIRYSGFSGYSSGPISGTLIVSSIIGLLLLVQGLGIWAAAHVGASIARSLIIIRLNTA